MLCGAFDLCFDCRLKLCDLRVSLGKQRCQKIRANGLLSCGFYCALLFALSHADKVSLKRTGVAIYSTRFTYTSLYYQSFLFCN